MSKIGRNSPCPCGSGKKFKRCCVDQESSYDNSSNSSNIPFSGPDDLSNKASDLFQKGKLDETEALASQLIQEFPELHDGFEYMALISDQRKNYTAAEKYYKKAAKVVDANGGYEPDFSESLLKKAKVMRAKIG